MKLRPLAQWFISNTASLAPRLYGFLVSHHHLGGFYPALLPHMRSPYMPYICSVIIFDLILTETRPPWKVLGLPSGGRWLWCLDGQQQGKLLFKVVFIIILIIAMLIMMTIITWRNHTTLEACSFDRCKDFWLGIDFDEGGLLDVTKVISSFIMTMTIIAMVVLEMMLNFQGID